MNWVGGARQRIKVKHERRMQREFFERRRKEKKFSKIMAQEGKKESEDTKMSQDLMFLYPLQSKLRTGSQSPSRRPVTYVDLSKPNQSRIQYNVKLEQNEESIPEQQSNSKLEFDKAANNEKENTFHASSRWMTPGLGISSMNRRETPLPKNILERHIEMAEHKSNKRHNTESVRHNEEANLDKFSDRFDGRQLKKDNFSDKEFIQSNKGTTDASDTKVPRIDTTNLFKNKKRFFPQKPADSAQKKDENIGSNKFRHGGEKDESRSNFTNFHSTPLSDIYKQDDEASQNILKFGNSNLGYFHRREVDDDSKMVNNDGYSSKIEVNDSHAMSDHRSVASKAIQEPFQFKSMFEETASIASWHRAEEMFDRQHYEVQNFADLHKETDEVKAMKEPETLFGNHPAMFYEAREIETVSQDPGLDRLHSNQRRRIMSCDVIPKEYETVPFVGKFKEAAHMPSTSWAGRETFASYRSFNETQSPTTSSLLPSHQYSNNITDFKQAWEMPDDYRRDCVRAGLSNKFWDGSEENPDECLENELQSDVLKFAKSVMNSQREDHPGGGTQNTQVRQLSIDSIEYDAASHISDSDMKSLGLEQAWVPNGKLDIRIPTSYQTELLMKPNSLEDDSEEDRFLQEMYKQRSNSRVPVEFGNEKISLSEAAGIAREEDRKLSEELSSGKSPIRTAYEPNKPPGTINASSDFQQSVHEALAEVMEMDSDSKEDESSNSSCDSKSVSEEKMEQSQLEQHQTSKNGQAEMISSEHGAHAKSISSNTCTSKNITQEEPLRSGPAQNRELNARTVQEENSSNTNEDSFDEKRAIPTALVAENIQIEAGTFYNIKKPATCYVAVQTDKLSCRRCGYIEGESIEDKKHIGAVTELATNMEVVSNVNSKIYSEAGVMNCFRDLKVKIENCTDTQIDGAVAGDCNQELARSEKAAEALDRQSQIYTIQGSENVEEMEKTTIEESQSEFMQSIGLHIGSENDEDISQTISPCVILTRSKTAKKCTQANLQ